MGPGGSCQRSSEHQARFVVRSGRPLDPRQPDPSHRRHLVACSDGARLPVHRVGVFEQITGPASDVEVHHLFAQSGGTPGSPVGAPVTGIEDHYRIGEHEPGSHRSRFLPGYEEHLPGSHPCRSVAGSSHQEPVLLAALDRHHQTLEGAHVGRLTPILEEARSPGCHDRHPPIARRSVGTRRRRIRVRFLQCRRRRCNRGRNRIGRRSLRPPHRHGRR